MPLIKASVRAPRKTQVAIEPLRPQDLSAALGSADVDTRRVAARAALQAGALGPLIAHLGEEPDPSVREMILTGVVRRHDDGHIRSLLDLLHHEDVQLRSAVIETLQSMGDDVLPALEGRLCDPDSDVRIFCINILQSIRAPRAPDIALKVALTDQNVNVCAAAVEVLAELGRPDMAQTLSGVASRFPDQPFLAFAVRAALKRMG